MREWLMLLFLVGFVSASVDISGYDVGGSYVFSDEISGKVNLTIEGESYNEKIILSDGRELELGGFLDDNGVSFDCLPSDCSMGYEASSGVADKTVSLELLKEKYVGFVLTGDNIVLEDIGFKISSDFSKKITTPLSIEFFESGTWSFSEFSDELTAKDWGCFDPVTNSAGPLIGTSLYCEMIDIGTSSDLRIGADITGTGENLNMALYPGSGVGGPWECSFNPGTEDGCMVSADVSDEVFSEGSYQVCVSADSLTSYRIYEDTAGENCGFAYNDGPADSNKDYGIFAQGVKYADANTMGAVSFGEEYVDAANMIISERYGGDCSEGCILPLKVFGAAQNFRIYSVSLNYTDNSEWDSNNLVYELSEIPAKVDFNGILDLSLLELVVSGDGVYFAELSGEDLFRETITMLPAPIISSVFPMNPPAGVPVNFIANIDFDKNKSLTYRWDFGDGSTVSQSAVPYTVHTYNDLKNYTLSLEVSAGGNLSSKKSFAIRAISPEDAVNVGLMSMKNALKNVKNIVNGFAGWYTSDLLEILSIASFEDELARLERSKNNSFDAEDFKDVAKELYTLDVPVSVRTNNFETPFLMSELGDVDLEPIAIISGGSSGDNEDYAGPILTWQNENIDVTMESEDVFVLYWKGEEVAVLSAYSFDLTSRWDRESYFVINKPFDELYFNGDVGARKAGTSTVIILNAGEKKSFKFYYKGNDRGSFFVSPKLSDIVLEANIDTTCNHNLVCEEDMGENSDNCRVDCKPTGKAIFFLILAILFFLIMYTALQIWYKNHYEAYLFRDGSQLFNLLMYVTNARARKITDDQIRAELRKQGWSSERVDYVIRKSVGKSVGMIEIIPIERTSAWMRNRKARQDVKKAMEVATLIQQQNNQTRRVP